MALNTEHVVNQRAQELYNELVSIRRELHKIPEPGYKETKTSDYIAQILKSWDIPFRRGIGGTGISVSIEKDPSLKTIALRADIDALPVNEQSGLSYSSEHEGYMHACGHDMHTTCLLGSLRILNEMKDSLPVNVKAIFQPAEELIPGGAGAVIKDRFLENPDVDSIFGLHMEPFLPTGEISVKSGAMMASTAFFTLHILGKGGHSAKPFSCIDPIPIAAQIITALQTIPSRMIDPLAPAVLSVTKISAGSAMNIIPESAVISGSVRALDADTGKAVPKMIEQLVSGIVTGYGADYTFDYEKGSEVLVNDGQMTEHVRSIGRKLLGSECVHEYEGTFGGEDFAQYLSRVPGCFFRLGCDDGRTQPVSLHNPTFNPDEKALLYGTAMFAGIAADYNSLT
jgi:amidohydrolase